MCDPELGQIRWHPTPARERHVPRQHDVLSSTSGARSCYLATALKAWLYSAAAPKTRLLTSNARGGLIAPSLAHPLRAASRAASTIFVDGWLVVLPLNNSYNI